MKTECSKEPLAFHDLNRRQIIGKFDGGEISSDGGGMLLREIEKRTHMLRRLSQCFTDHRNPERIEHSVEKLIKQRLMAIALGYEDLNDPIGLMGGVNTYAYVANNPLMYTDPKGPVKFYGVWCGPDLQVDRHRIK